MGYPTGKHEPRKQLSLFWESDLWVQSGAVGAPAASLREFDGEVGTAWNYFDSLEFWASAYSFNNVNRGFSLARPDGYKDGWKIETRYYFGSGDIYDTGTLPFVGIGYYPSGSLAGNNGQVFNPGLLARRYLTEDLRTPFRSYFYGGVKQTAENGATPRLFGYRYRPGRPPLWRPSRL
jgi:hypothetical protein